MPMLLSFIRGLSSFKNSTVLKKANLDIRRIVARHHDYRDSLMRRKQENLISKLEYIVLNRDRERGLTDEINRIRHERTKLGQILRASKGESLEEVKKQLVDIKVELKSLENKRDEISRTMHEYAEALPNTLDATVPWNTDIGEIVEMINCSSEEDAIFRKPKLSKTHKEICEEFDMVDFSVASRISGSSWYFMKGDGALLENALIQYALQKAREAGYSMIIPPSIVNAEVINACGFKPKDQNNEQQVYNIENTDLSLIATAEIPLAALHSSSIFPTGQSFPVKYVGTSRSFRAEAGARGIDTKGLYRVHEFSKVELFHFTEPEKAAEELENLKCFQISLIKDLGIVAKMINMPTSDLGAPAMKKYDCEAWMPGRNAWGELTSTSNCGDYQARRLGIKYMPIGSDKPQYVATLNGTCMAVPRVIIAIIEQNYDHLTETITIPPVLRPFMGGKEKICKQ